MTHYGDFSLPDECPGCADCLDEAPGDESAILAELRQITSELRQTNDRLARLETAFLGAMGALDAFRPPWAKRPAQPQQ